MQYYVVNLKTMTFVGSPYEDINEAFERRDYYSLQGLGDPHTVMSCDKNHAVVRVPTLMRVVDTENTLL